MAFAAMLLALTVAQAITEKSPIKCPVAQAIYVQARHPLVQVRIGKLPKRIQYVLSDLYLKVTINQKNFWFVMDRGNAIGPSHIYSSARPLDVSQEGINQIFKSADIDFYDANLRRLDDIIMSNEDAPTYLRILHTGPMPGPDHSPQYPPVDAALSEGDFILSRCLSTAHR